MITQRAWLAGAMVVALMTCTALAVRGVAQQPGRAPAQATTVESMMGAALHLEEVEGKFAEAIAAYQKVVAAPAATRAQKARAQFRIGACYETGDGKAVLGIRSSEFGDNARLEVWRFPVDGSAPNATGLTMDNIDATRAQPNGSKVLFAAGRFTYEIRALEHFLPATKK